MHGSAIDAARSIFAQEAEGTTFTVSGVLKARIISSEQSMSKPSCDALYKKSLSAQRRQDRNSHQKVAVSNEAYRANRIAGSCGCDSINITDG
jgi:hypothetical protein